MKKTSLLLALMLFALALLPVSAGADSKGVCGPALKWTLDNNGLI